MRWFTSGLLAGFVLSCSAANVTIAGTGVGTVLLQQLGADYAKIQPDVQIVPVLPPLSSGGGLRALAANRIDIAVVGRSLTADEQKAVGTVIKFASTPLVIASSDGRRARGFSLDDLARLFNGELIRWDNNAPMNLVMRSPFESDFLVLATASSKLDTALKTASLRPGLAYAENDLDTIDLLDKTPGSIGITTLGLIRLLNRPLVIYPIDGHTQTSEWLKPGYRFTKPLHLVVSKSPTPATLSFVSYLRSRAVRARLRDWQFASADE